LLGKSWGENVKLFVLGLDCAPPKILYDGYGVEMPNIESFLSGCARYELRSCFPPITIPAWLCMFTGLTPGELGIYGFRHRKPGDIKESYIVDSRRVRARTLWEEVGAEGKRVCVVGVPPTYPPKPINGYLVTDFTTPSSDKPYTWPPWLKREIESVVGKYIFDILYRSWEKEKVFKELMDMLRQHLKLVKWLLKEKKWDLFIYVEIAVDRAHHAFWRYFDEGHPKYEYHEVFSKVIPAVYREIDAWFSEVIDFLPRDTAIVIASDHGVKAMKGAFAINEWLIEQGYLKLKEKPRKPGTDLSRDIIDWNSTIAWGWGGYYSRIFINLRGREPHGVVKQEEYEDVVKQLKNELSKVKGPRGEQWRNIVVTPREVYPRVEGDAPDLMAIFDDLSWRAAGTIGWGTAYLEENDRGPDDAVHDWLGVFAVYDPSGTIPKGHRGVIGITEVYRVLRSLTRL